MASTSKGDPRVHLVMNLVLSGVFSTVVVWGLSAIADFSFGWDKVGVLTLVLAIVTYIVTR